MCYRGPHIYIHIYTLCGESAVYSRYGKRYISYCCCYNCYYVKPAQFTTELPQQMIIIVQYRVNRTVRVLSGYRHCCDACSLQSIQQEVSLSLFTVLRPATTTVVSLRHPLQLHTLCAINFVNRHPLSAIISAGRKRGQET